MKMFFTNVLAHSVVNKSIDKKQEGFFFFFLVKNDILEVLEVFLSSYSIPAFF